MYCSDNLKNVIIIETFCFAHSLYKWKDLSTVGGDKLDRNKYIEAVKRNNKRIYQIALSYLGNHYDAEDIMQSVFLKLWNTNKVFNNDEHIDKWLTITCINKCKDHFKLHFVKNTVSLDEVNEYYTFDSNDKIDIFNSIMSLPKKERIVVHLFYYEDLTTDEISNLLNSNPNTIKTRLKRARTRLKSILGDDWIDEQ